MRFARLSLERYGRFSDCTLDFRPGQPDLHIVYGANEAGKTTSLAAVSDLLFGFKTRSPYNFLYDYTLLRVGAVLEEDGESFACRRKKGTAGTLLDDRDAAIDEAPLLRMLKGQTRETFGLSFGLDQTALRSGGRAMVEAKNDLGRTLFAAGSGLTGVTETLKALEGEADRIWGPGTKASRSVAQAQRRLADAQRAIRDDALKPKAWADAKATADRAREALEALQAQRAAVRADLRAAERVRRIAPLVRQRASPVGALHTHADTVDLGRAREDVAIRLIAEVADATRARSEALHLSAEVEERRGRVTADPRVLAEVDGIDALLAEAGAEAKAGRDMVGLRDERATAVAQVARLRAEAGGNADAAPERDTAERLRDLARIHGDLLASGREIAEQREAIDARRARARPVEPEDRAEGDALIDAVDVARALGPDADARCEAAQRKAVAASGAAAEAIARLVPWVGDIDALRLLPTGGQEEIEATRDALSALMAGIGRDEDQARRSGDQADADALRIAQVTTGTAVSPEEIAQVRAARDAHWQPLRGHILTGAPLDTPDRAVADFEARVVEADTQMNRRVALADGSGRLSLLEQTRAMHALDAAQAWERAAAAKVRQADLQTAWTGRLADAGLPDLGPVRLLAWQAHRKAAEEADTLARTLSADADRLQSQRDGARVGLCTALGIPDDGTALAPVLTRGERRRGEIEEERQQIRLSQSALAEVAADAATLDRRHKRHAAEVSVNAAAWAVAAAGLTLDVANCGKVLGRLDDLRLAVDAVARLDHRIEGIARDARDHAARVADVAHRVRVPPGDDALRTLRDMAAAARTAATELALLEEEARRRTRDHDEAQARLLATEEAMAPLLRDTRAATPMDLAEAVERSRARRDLVAQIAAFERQIEEAGDGLPLDALIAAVADTDPDATAQRVSTLTASLERLDADMRDAAIAHGAARTSFAGLDPEGASAADAAADAEQARAELEALAGDYILKRAQAVMLKWAIESYRARNQDPMLLRAGALFSTLTTGRYAALQVDTDAPQPRLLGLRDDGRTMVEVDAMSEGTTDQLFLALRLAALERSVAAGISLPFLADDLFVNFDDERAEAGFRVLAQVAGTTQVLFFTHHPHLAAIAKSVVGADLHSECALG